VQYSTIIALTCFTFKPRISIITRRFWHLACCFRRLVRFKHAPNMQTPTSTFHPFDVYRPGRSAACLNVSPTKKWGRRRKRTTWQRRRRRRDTAKTTRERRMGDEDGRTPKFASRTRADREDDVVFDRRFRRPSVFTVVHNFYWAKVKHVGLDKGRNITALIVNVSQYSDIWHLGTINIYILHLQNHGYH